MRATFTDINAVKPPTGGLPQDEQDEPHRVTRAGHEAEKPAERKAPPPGLGVMATHIVPYGLHTR